MNVAEYFGGDPSVNAAERPLTPIRVPPGWRILDRRDCSCGHEAFILCEKADDRPHDTQFVTWEADLRNGGCYHGHYTEDRVEATADLDTRFRRHEGTRA